ncbi:MAG: DMT family transporter [Bacteroidetes bacterium]|nr:DMT family transporter [Bacteroidota bacterium]
MKEVKLKHFALLHFIVFIWGFSPILGRYITVNALSLVWYRVLISVAVMAVYIVLSKQSFVLHRKQFIKLGTTGLIILIHWLSFYGAIKVSNVSVTMAAFSTGTLFSAIIEPVFYKRAVRKYEIIIGIIIVLAIGMILSIEFKYWLGILLGMFAALTSSIFGVLNGLFVKEIKPAIISFYELFSALIGLSIYFLFTRYFSADFFELDNASIIGLLLLSLVCTVFPFIASVNLSKYISPYTIVLTVNLETVYGIIWAIILYKENKELTIGFYIGLLIILIAIFLNSYFKSLDNKKQKLNLSSEFNK